MTQYLILFRSLTHAQRAARALERAGITAVIIKPPQGLGGSGCRQGGLIRKGLREARNLLERYQIPYGKRFEKKEGQYREVDT